jgi:rhomboid protease GluP
LNQYPPYAGAGEHAPAPQTPVIVKQPTTRPIVTYGLIGLTVVVFLLQIGSQLLFQGNDYPAYLGEKINELIVAGQLWRLFTPILLHGSILHIAFNMYALYALGPQLERFYGHGRYLLLYVLGGFAGNVASFIFSPYPSLGSSTAIFGLLGAEGVFLYHNRSLFGRSAQRALTNIVVIAVANLIIGLSPGIDNWGHVGGLAAGTLFAWFAGPRLRLEGMAPSFSLVDEREQGQVVIAGAVVGALFAILAGVTILARGG